MGSAVSSIANIFTGADSTKAAGNQAAAQMSQAARDASAAAAFRPVGMTTAFGTSQFTRETDPATGMPYISSAGYTAAPELASLQNQLMAMYGGGVTSAQQQAQQLQALSPAAGQLFGLGEQYLATSPEQARQDYMQTQQAALAGSRESQLANVRNSLFQTGRSGLATGGTTTGMQATNPEMAAYYNAIAQQDLQLAANAEQAAQQRQTFGAGLFGTGAQLLGTQSSTAAGAYSPLQTLLGTSGQVETMSQMPYTLGLQLGQAQQPGQTAGAQMYQQGLSQAAQTQYGATQAANAANAGFWGGLMQAGGTLGGAAIKAGMFSDINMKENIKLIGKLGNGLNLYKFDYKPEFKDVAGHGSFIGVMAQEVEKVIPDAVSVANNGYKQVDYSLVY